MWEFIQQSKTDAVNHFYELYGWDLGEKENRIKLTDEQKREVFSYLVKRMTYYMMHS